MFEKIKRLFTPAESMDPQQARAFINDHAEGTYTLLDVRQPKEYESAHIPGAKLIPLGELSDSYEELDKERPVIVYCAIGGRSRIAAQMLAGAGFTEVYNLSGGIVAWQGGKAEGPVGLNLDMITGDESPKEIVTLAYGMEESLGRFYRIAGARTRDPEVGKLLTLLASIEDRHKQYLLDVYRGLGGSSGEDQDLERAATSTVMEGGFEIEAFLENNRHLLDSVPSLLDLAMMVEAQALDLYLRFSTKAANELGKEVLLRIADEEKAHIQSLGRLRDDRS